MTPRDKERIDTGDTFRRYCWCGIYTRQSRESAGEFSSCDAQFEACFEFLRSHFDEGWVCNGRRYDDEGQSSEALDRPGLQRLRDDIHGGKVDRVVIYRLDRLSRRIVDCVEFLWELHDLGVPLTIVTPPELGLTADNTFTLNLMASFAEFEQEMIRDRLSEARAALKAHGRRVAGGVPLGYEADATSKQLLIVPYEANQIREIFQMALDCLTPTRIAQVVNERGWRTKQRTSKSGRVSGGGRWTARQVLATLTNPIYAGLVRDGSQLRPGIHEPMIHCDQFEEVRRLVEARRTRKPGRSPSTVSWPLRSILQCGLCGRGMSPSISGHGNLNYRYYCCRSHAGRRLPCPSVSISAEEIHPRRPRAPTDLRADRRRAG